MNKHKKFGNIGQFIFDNKVILLFLFLCIACTLIAGANLSYVAGEVFTRFGRNTCLVLALIIPCLAGLGMNFGIVVGAMAAQIAIFWVVHWGFTGVPGLLLSVVLCTPLAIFFGWLLGILYNHTKGAEMIAGLILGFFADGLYRLFVLYIIGGVIPFDDPNLLPRGFGLRNAFDLTGTLKYSLDDVSFLSVLLVGSIISLLALAVNYLYNKKKGNVIDKKDVVKKLVYGVVGIVLALISKQIPFLNDMLGGTRVVLTDAIKIGSILAIIYSVVMFIMTKPAKNSKEFKKYILTVVCSVVLFVLTFVKTTKIIFNSVRLPACTYAIIVLFCFFNTWIFSTRLGQNMRTVGQDRGVATSAGLNVDKIRIIATCISTVLAAWGQIVFLQNLGTFNTVQQQSNVGLYAVAAILVGGANAQKATNKQAIIGVILFHTLFVVAPLAATKIFGDPAISEYIRMFITYGVIAVSLAMHAWQKGGKKKKDEDNATEQLAVVSEDK